MERSQTTLIGWHCVLVVSAVAVVPGVLQPHSSDVSALIVGTPFLLGVVALPFTSAVIAHLQTTPSDYWHSLSVHSAVVNMFNADIHFFVRHNLAADVLTVAVSMATLTLCLVGAGQPTYALYARTKTPCKARASLVGALIASAVLAAAVGAALVLVYPQLCAISADTELITPMTTMWTRTLFAHADAVVAALAILVVCALAATYAQAAGDTLALDLFAARCSQTYAPGSPPSIVGRRWSALGARVLILAVVSMAMTGAHLLLYAYDSDGTALLWAWTKLVWMAAALAAPVTAVYLMGMISTCANRFGAYAGVICGFVLSVLLITAHLMADHVS